MLIVSREVIFVWVAVIALAAFSYTAAGQDCVYKDEFGNPVVHIGGVAFANFVALLGSGPSMGIPEDYELWDLNADGILDKDQFALLTEILCMSGIAAHPTVDFVEIRSTFEDNVDLYWNMVDRLIAAEASLIAGAPDLRQVGIEIGEAAIAAGVYDDPLPPEVFIGGVLPDVWIGATWKDLRYALKDTGDTVNDLLSQGLIGGPYSAVWLLLNNTSMAYLMAALWGLDSSLTENLFNMVLFDIVAKMVSFKDLNWPYILGELFAYGLTATAVANAESSIATIDLDENVVPAPDVLAITSNGEDALHAGVVWGDVTLGDMYVSNSGDISAVWAEILTQLPALPVGGRVVSSLCFFSVLVCGFLQVNRKMLLNRS